MEKWKQTPNTPTNLSLMYLQLMEVYACGYCVNQPHGGNKNANKMEACTLTSSPRLIHFHSILSQSPFMYNPPKGGHQ